MYNLLFVDDELEVLESVKRVLSWDKLKVRVIGWCDNALDALELMVNEHVDILITDVKMPVMDGLELVNRAKAMYPDIKSLVLSGYGEFTLAQSAISLGVKGYLLKPCEKEVLEENIKKCVELIEKERLASSDQFEQRQMQIEELYDELMELKLGEENNDKETVRKIALRYRDFSILRSAIMMAFIQHGQSMQSLQEIARELVHIKDSEEIIRCAVGLLREISKNSGGDENGLGCDVVGEVILDGVTVSSTHIRQLVADGNMEEASRYLGHPHTLTDTVGYGYRIGRSIGAPTINTSIPEGVIVPRHGVYATRVWLPEGPKAAVTNVGYRPTFDNDEHLTVESNILDFNGNLYGSQVRLEFLSFLRDEIRFPSPEALGQQIQKDIARSREYFAQHE